MRLILTLMFGLIAGVASATTYDDAGLADRLVNRYKQLKAMQDLTAPQITSVTCAAGNTLGIPARLTIQPSDTGWAGVLSSLNTALNAKVTAAKAELEAIGVTGVP